LGTHYACFTRLFIDNAQLTRLVPSRERFQYQELESELLLRLWSSEMSNPRAARYRRLALQEPDSENARLLQLIADEADRGVLCTSELIKPKVRVEPQASAAQ
jgi:hypothetical protein